MLTFVIRHDEYRDFNNIQLKGEFTRKNAPVGTLSAQLAHRCFRGNDGCLPRVWRVSAILSGRPQSHQTTP